MGSFSCWDSMFPRERSPVGCAERREIPSEANAGSPCCAITEKLSLRWTSSQCQRSRSAWSIARRRILHFNVTKHPTSSWIIQQLREAFPFESSPRFLIFDLDRKYGLEVPVAVRSLKISPVRTSFESPWQNGVAERWVESCRRDLLDHIIAVNERHLKRLLSEYVRYYLEDRTHLGLGKGTPNGRVRCMASGPILSHDRLGGLHHRYGRVA